MKLSIWTTLNGSIDYLGLFSRSDPTYSLAGVPYVVVTAKSAGTAPIVSGSGPRFLNMSVRAIVPLNGSIIPGFVVADTPNHDKLQILVRAIGPTLALYGVGGTLGDPRLTIYDRGGRVIATNDDWELGDRPSILAAVARVGAFPLATGTKDAALVLCLAPRRSKLPPIRVGPCVVGGVPLRFDSRATLRKAVAGRAIEVTSAQDYANLYHVFARWKHTEPSLAGMAIVRRQVGASRWLVLVLPGSKPVPQFQPDGNYHPKRGRYQRYAARIANGETLTFGARAEAVKVRRAWQFYVPRLQRVRLRCVVLQPTPRKFAVAVRSK